MMKRLYMIATAVVLSLGVASLGYAQAPPAADKKMEEKKGDAKMEKKGDAKMEKKADAKDGKKAVKKADKKMDKKDAANPCAAKAAEKK
jgi:hypothetical protein